MDRFIGVLRIVLRLFWVIPIKKNKIVLTAYNGRQFGCSPKYLALKLSKQENKVVYFALKNSNTVLPNGIRFLKYRSFLHFFHLMTAKYIVINSSGVTDLLPYRKSQVLINTWHGGGYFKVMGNDFFVSDKQKRQRAISGKNTSVFLASCESFAEQLPRAMSIDPKTIYKSGLPRNDLMFTNGEPERIKIRRRYNTPSECGIVIYAPTYRDGVTASVNDSGFEPIDISIVLGALKKRFGKDFVFLFRAHHDMIPDNLSDGAINVSDYDDMQELLVASDVFITDYSSCMWDFSLQNKPGFLYTPDLQQYESKHSFGTKTSDWPYKICLDNQQLAEAIRAFDSIDNKNRIDHFLEICGSYERGTATTNIISTIIV